MNDNTAAIYACPAYALGILHFELGCVHALNAMPSGWSALDVCAYWTGVEDACADACPDIVASMATQHRDAF